MEKYEAVESLIKLWILHTILTLILFVISIIIIYIYQRSLQGETLDENKEKEL